MEELLKQILTAIQRPATDVQNVSMTDAAKILGISRERLRDLMDAGLIRYMMTSPYCGYRIPLWEIKRFQEQYLGYDLSDPMQPVKIKQAS